MSEIAIDKNKGRKKFDFNDPIAVELAKAKIHLLKSLPFFGNLSLKLQYVEIEEGGWCPTAATDGRNIYYNRKFIQSILTGNYDCKSGVTGNIEGQITEQGRDQLRFVIVHEIMHCIFDHVGRRGYDPLTGEKRDAKLWNYAIDLWTNYAIGQTNSKTKMVNGSLFSNKFTDELTSEEIYRMLKEEKDAGGDVSEYGVSFDVHLGQEPEEGDDDEGGEGENGQGKGKIEIGNGKPGAGAPVLTEEDLKEISEEMQQAVLNAAQYSSAGSIPGGILRMIEELNSPKISWRELIDSEIRAMFKCDYSFRRINRRSHAYSRAFGQRMILPGQKDGEKISVDIAIDTSGSMTNEMLLDLLSEVKGIMEAFEDFELSVMCFDTQTYNFKKFTPRNLDDINEYQLDGGGGTDFSAFWNYYKENDIIPEKLIVFTDGYCWDDGQTENRGWGPDNYCPDTLWILHSNPGCIPPFGTHAYYEDA